jgi:hypothetical protein
MRKKIVLNYDASTGFIYDANDVYIASNLTLTPFDDIADQKSGVAIDDLVKLRNAGFTTDEIIELKRKDLL